MPKCACYGSTNYSTISPHAQEIVPLRVCLTARHRRRRETQSGGSGLPNPSTHLTSPQPFPSLSGRLCQPKLCRSLSLVWFLCEPNGSRRVWKPSGAWRWKNSSCDSNAAHRTRATIPLKHASRPTWAPHVWWINVCFYQTRGAEAREEVNDKLRRS